MALAPTQSLVETPSRLFYREAMEVLNRAGVPFLVGGAFAFIHQAGIDKSTKDLDIFARPSDVQRLLEACAAAGYETELVFSHWLAKIRSPEGFIDVIFSSGNGIAAVDDGWFEHATDGEVLAVPVKIAPAEETVWSKAFVMERERFDGADVVAPDPGPRRADGLAPPARAVRPALAGAPGPSDSVRVHLPFRAFASPAHGSCMTCSGGWRTS